MIILVVPKGNSMNPLIYNTSTTSKRSLWPEKTKDLWVMCAWDSRLSLSNYQEYDDWASALGANTLGYDAYVKGMFTEEVDYYPATSLPWQIEYDFAEQFCQAMGTEAVRFFKGGSDAVSCAVRLARGFTGRDYVIVFDKSYHGTGDWFGPGLWNPTGIPDRGDTIVYNFGEVVDLYGPYVLSQTAAIVVEPVPKAIELPPDGWLQHLREVCDEHGIILIFDQVILGYRHTLSGFPGPSGVRPDLSCYGKAMGQGAAVSACTGREDILSLLTDRVHFSGTNNGEPLPLQIAQWTLGEYLEKDICAILEQKGFNLQVNLASVGFETRGLKSRFEVVIDPAKKMDMVEYCFDRGILFPGFASMAVSHTQAQVERLVHTLVEWRSKCSLLKSFP